MRDQPPSGDFASRQPAGEAGNGLPRVAVLLATCNGERYLPEQIGSLAAQDADAIDLWISDDRSSDGTPALLDALARDWQRGGVEVMRGPGKGFSENFRFLLTRPQIDADYVAFCDQDDLWDRDRLAAGISWLQRQGGPAMYCGRTRLMWPDGRRLGLSRLFSRTPSFRNAVVQSIAGGNTMVFNRSAHRLLREASSRTGFVAHDWWTYQIVSGAGGAIHYSPEPRVDYRQHADNLIGNNRTWRARLSRLRSALGGGFTAWNDVNLEALQRCEDLLTPDSRAVLRDFALARSGGLFARIAALRRSGIYRQSTLGQVGLYVACAIRRL